MLSKTSIASEVRCPCAARGVLGHSHGFKRSKYIFPSYAGRMCTMFVAMSQYEGLVITQGVY